MLSQSHKTGPKHSSELLQTVQYLDDEIAYTEGQNDNQEDGRGHANHQHGGPHLEKASKPHRQCGGQHGVNHIHILAETIDDAAQGRRIEEGKRQAEHGDQHAPVQVPGRSATSPSQQQCHGEGKNTYSTATQPGL